VTGCDAARAATVRKECSDIQVLLNVADMRGQAPEEEEDPVKEVCRRAVSACCCGINVDFRLCSEQLVHHARLRYLPVSVWTVDRIEDMAAMIALGVDSITTYEPARLKRLVRELHPGGEGLDPERFE
jgi:glycerophosphoryl diester phosphodiesterase